MKINGFFWKLVGNLFEIAIGTLLILLPVWLIKLLLLQILK